MPQDTTEGTTVQMGPKDVLTELLRQGAQQMLTAAIQSEVAEYIAVHGQERQTDGHRLVVRNGYLPERDILSGVGPIQVRQPRVNDKRVDAEGRRIRFTSKILPPYLRRTRSIDEMIPWLYLKGISTGDFTEALQALLGPDAPGLSATNIVRLKASWQQEWKDWDQRSLAGKHYVYVWADGVYFNVRLEDQGNQSQCILVLIGATPEGKKELIALAEGYRESEQSWKELLLSVKARGLEAAPKLAVGDGALGFWAALRKVWPETREQRCWVHKTANVLNKMPKHVQGKAKGMVHGIWMAETKARRGGRRRRSLCLWTRSRRSTPRRRRAWRRTGRNCWRFTTSRPSTGGTFGRRIRSNRRSRRCGCGRTRPRVAAAGRHA